MTALKHWLRRSLAVLGFTAAGNTALAQAPAALPPPDNPPPVISILPEGAGALPGIEQPPPGAQPLPPQVVGDGACDPCKCGFDFSKTPPVRPLPRPGMFFITPTGPGYYSVLDRLRGECREKPVQSGYPAFALMQNSFYDADWRFLDNPKTPPTNLSERLKRMHLGDNWLWSVGGASWYRYFNETNSRLTGVQNTYSQLRSRVYSDLWYKDIFRIHAEGIFANSYGMDLPPLAIDVEQFDFLNLFVDLKVANIADKPVYARIGRQELLFGSQRLISPLDWANTRRTFQGARFMRTGEKFDLDMFWVQPVIPTAGAIDSVDNNQNLVGAWGTYKPRKGTALDLYYLMLDNTNTVTQTGIFRAPATTHTVGSRFVGDKDNTFLWDFEGAFQFGDRGAANIFAGMATAGLGYHPKDMRWNPTFWMYYDYASGDNTPNAGNFNTFNQLFPFGHFYMGWADAIGRQNIHDVSASVTMYPAKWMTLWLQYHNFWLASSKDALYNPGGAAVRRDPTGASGNFVGNEVDIITNFHLSKRTDLLVSYGYLIAGDFLRNTQPGGGNANVGTLAMILNYRW